MLRRLINCRIIIIIIAIFLVNFMNICKVYRQTCLLTFLFKFLTSIDYKKDGYRQRNVRQFLKILASPGYAPGTIAVNATWMKQGIQCLSNASQHVPTYLQPFPSNSTRKFKTILAHFGLPWVSPWDNRGKCYMDEKKKRIQ